MFCCVNKAQSSGAIKKCCFFTAKSKITMFRILCETKVTKKTTV